ncbi:hypothetical protein NEUTE1DRAFT_119202 [Neurospora tetrasperma FGSC 2508]|uniref:Uncharacterized protein n=1 Tax=Neurospora tetrasperma (strain FGSC 2508 / ATCC MYA-4615 / P0657) TaxID=510951 RepID=F8N430_NEUT8|nr:uncharacterized protein NEUTE1DRAFT_119202 [Neurospora tetrasperma FGSC 2508]EGO53473.1 hypothetical protein NEUTE1DRAFT_119202 [Neurospora tetrasperma FGSC 2508]
MGFSGFPSFRLFTFDTLSPLSRHTQTFAAHAPKAVLTSRDPALVPGRSNSFLILCEHCFFFLLFWLLALMFWRFFTLISRLMCCFGYWRKRSSGVYCVTLAERLAWRDMAGHGGKGAIPGLDFFWTHLNWRGAMEYSLSNVLTLVQRAFFTWGETFGGFGPGLSDIHLFSSHEKFQGVLMAVLGYHSNTYTGHRLVGKPDEDGLPVATCMSYDTISFPMYYSTIYDTLYERNFGLLSIMNSGRALDE